MGTEPLPSEQELDRCECSDTGTEGCKLKDVNANPRGFFEKLARRYSTPRAVQRFLRNLDYNRESQGETQRSAFSALQARQAHCMEAALIAAAILEHRGYEPQVLSMESKDDLDHVVFVFQERGLWGTVGRSRDEGLHGRAPRFKTVRALVDSYFDPYVDKTGRITGFAIARLEEAGVDWRFSRRNLWKLEQYLIDFPHRTFAGSDARYGKLHRAYLSGSRIETGPGWW